MEANFENTMSFPKRPAQKSPFVSSTSQHSYEDDHSATDLMLDTGLSVLSGTFPPSAYDTRVPAHSGNCLARVTAGPQTTGHRRKSDHEHDSSRHPESISPLATQKSHPPPLPRLSDGVRHSGKHERNVPNLYDLRPKEYDQYGRIKLPPRSHFNVDHSSYEGHQQYGQLESEILDAQRRENFNPQGLLAGSSLPETMAYAAFAAQAANDNRYRINKTSEPQTSSPMGSSSMSDNDFNAMLGSTQHSTNVFPTMAMQNRNMSMQDLSTCLDVAQPQSYEGDLSSLCLPDIDQNMPLFSYSSDTTGRIRIEAGEHLELDNITLNDKDVLPYIWLENLSFGSSTSVEKIQDMHTSAVYARKVFSSRHIQSMKRELHNQVQNMKRLAPHRHIVQVHATYIFKQELALVLDPVADGGDLASFLVQYLESGCSIRKEVPQNKILAESFGCLASGLAFMHQESIRYKDIKPQHILINRGTVMYTDFALSHCFGDAGQNEIMDGFTRRYCAPEVLVGGNRTSKSDIFSLGCVYIEIFHALDPASSREELLAGHFSSSLALLASKGITVYDVLLTASLEEPDLYKEYNTAEEIERMVQLEPSDRCPASVIAHTFCRLGRCCSECRAASLGSRRDRKSPAGVS